MFSIAFYESVKARIAKSDKLTLTGKMKKLQKNIRLKINDDNVVCTMLCLEHVYGKVVRNDIMRPSYITFQPEYISNIIIYSFMKNDKLHKIYF